MNARERVLKAIRRMDGNPDRVPIQFDLCKQHIEYFSKKYGIPVDITDNIYEDVTWRISANELRVRMGSDMIALPVTLVVITGGIDLSLGSIATLSGITGGLVYAATQSDLLAVVCAMVVGCLCGWFNSLLVTRLNIPAMVTTLATMRNARKAILSAYLCPEDAIRAAEYAGDYTARLALQEQRKTLPVGAVWDYYCAQKNVPVGADWLQTVRQYEKDVLSGR